MDNIQTGVKKTKKWGGKKKRRNLLPGTEILQAFTIGKRELIDTLFFFFHIKNGCLDKMP